MTLMPLMLALGVVAGPAHAKKKKKSGLQTALFGPSV